MIVAFTALMNWVRQYLVLHTGNRIDAVLGQQVVGHLFRLESSEMPLAGRLQSPGDAGAARAPVVQH